MSDERKLTDEDRDKIHRLLESGTLENVTLALSLIEETADQEDIADIFTMNVIVELICLGDPLLQAASIMRKCPNTSKVFVEALANPFSMTSRDYRSRKIDLSRFTTFSSSAFAELVNAEYDLNLDDLTELSDAAAQSLSKHEGDLSLYGLSELSDAAAESLSKHKGKLSLHGLTSLSDGPGHIALAERVSKCDGNLNLNGLTELSDAAAESLSKHERSEWGDREGDLYLNGLTELSDAAAKSLCKHDGDLYLNGLTELSDTVAVQLASHNNLHTSTKIKRQIKKAISTRNQQARKSAKTGKSVLTKKQSIKLRKLFRSKDADNVLIAVELIDASEATQDDISVLLSSSVLSLLVNTWDVRVWNALAPLLLSYPNAKREFTELANKRVQHQSSYGFIAGFYGEATKPLALLGLKIIDDTSRELGYLTSLSDAGAESLSKHEGDLDLYGLTSLSDAAAESLSKHEGDLSLSGLKSLSDDAAESLSKHEGSLNLDDLTELSDGPGHISLASSLSKHEGDLSLSGLTSLSDAAAESLSKHEGDLSLYGLISLSDAAAESLSKHEGEINLRGLTSLSYGPGHIALAERLSKQERLLLDGLTSLSDAAAESLSNHKGHLCLSGLTSLSDAAAESLSKHEGTLNLSGLTELSDAAAESLRKHEGTLDVDGLTSLSDAAAKSLSKRETKFTSWHISLDNLPASAAQILRDAGHGL